MTYDLFYFMNAYIERMLMKLAEKTKLNEIHNRDDGRRFLFSEDQMAYMVTTRNLDQDNYGVKVTDGKKEKDILQKLEMWFPQEINAGIISTADVAKFLTESNFIRALRVLETARTRYEETQSEESKRQAEIAREQLEQQMQISREEREDNQSHDRDMEALRTEGKKEVKAMEVGGKGLLEGQKINADQMNAGNEL